MPRRGENIHKRKDGRWEGRYIREYATDGRAKYGSVYGKTYAETKQKLLEISRGMEGNSPVIKGETIRYREVLLCWLEHRRMKIKEQSYVKYEQIIKKQILPDIGTIAVKQIEEAYINRFLLQKSNRGRLDGKGGLAPGYVRTIAFIMKSALDFAAKKGYCKALQGEVVLPQAKKGRLDILTLTEQFRLEQNASAENSDKKLGILLSLYMGLRVGEVCGISWRDINFDDATLHIHHTVERISIRDAGADHAKTKLVLTDVKSDASDRVLPIPSKLLQILKECRKGDTDFVLQGERHPYTDPRTLQYFFQRYLEHCHLRYVNYHVLRHTFATRCMESGMDIKSLSEILGHSNVNITLNTYVHSSLDHKRKQLETMTAICGRQ